MHRRPEMRRGAMVLASIGLLVLLALVGSVWAVFTTKTVSGGNLVTSKADWIAPTAASSVIGKSQGGTPGFIRQGGGYNVYANVTDAGNPPSGIASVTGDVSLLTAGLTATPLSSGSFTMGPTGYNYRSAGLTAKPTLAAASYAYSLTSKDIATNSRTQTGYTVTVDNTAPSASSIQANNKTGNTVGRPEVGDTLVFTNSEQLDPYSVLAGWTGASTNVVVRIDNNVAAAGGNDQVTIFNAANTVQLPLGVVNLGRTDYVTATTSFGLTGTASTMLQSTVTTTITLGTPSTVTTTAATTGTMIWTPSATATDRAGNAATITARSESGTLDKEF